MACCSSGWSWLHMRYSVVSSPDFDEHVGDAQSEGSGEVDQHKRVHSGQENAAQRRDESAQTANTHQCIIVHTVYHTSVSDGVRRTPYLRLRSATCSWSQLVLAATDRNTKHHHWRFPWETLKPKVDLGIVQIQNYNTHAFCILLVENCNFCENVSCNHPSTKMLEIIWHITVLERTLNCTDSLPTEPLREAENTGFALKQSAQQTKLI